MTDDMVRCSSCGTPHGSIEDATVCCEKDKPGVVGRKHNCANCNIRVVCPVGRAFVPVINGGYAERIGLRCDLWEADE